MTWMTLHPDDVVSLAEAVGVDPYGKSARRLREEIIAGFERAFSGHPQRSRGGPGVASGERHSGIGAAGGRNARQLAEEEAALGDAWLAHHGLKPLPGDDVRAFLRYRSPLEEEGVMLTTYSLGSSDEEEALAAAWLAYHGLSEDERR